MVLLNSTDLRNENNTIYEVTRAGERECWYVVKDLGATLGETGVIRPIRNDLDAFERDPLLIVAKNGHIMDSMPLEPPDTLTRWHLDLPQRSARVYTRPKRLTRTSTAASLTTGRIDTCPRPSEP